jgi:hypothetical protein
MKAKHLLLGISGTAAAVALVTTASVAAGTGGSRATPHSVAAGHVRAPVSCGQPESVMGYVGLPRAGQEAGIRQTLGPRLLAQVASSPGGKTTVVALVAAGPGAALQRQYFSRFLPAYPQAGQSQLRSCSMTLSNRPADRVLTSAAVASFVRAGYFRSAAAAWSGYPQILVSDDPLTAGSVIVTFSVLGPVVKPKIPAGAAAGPHPPLHGLDTYTAIVKLAGALVTGVAKGGF